MSIMGCTARMANLGNTGRVSLDKFAEPAECGVLLVIIFDVYECLAPVNRTPVSPDRLHLHDQDVPSLGE